jgi:hypothetical protein
VRIVDVALLATGLGQPAVGQLEHALHKSGLPEFHRAQLGSMNKDYPDLVLAAVLGIDAFLVHGDRATVIVGAKTANGGKPILVCEKYTVSDGRIARARMFWFDPTPSEGRYRLSRIEQHRHGRPGTATWRRVDFGGPRSMS